MYMISHAWSDNEISDPIARDFLHEFGSENVWYDRWNIQPGDSITGGINEGLERCSVFFLFLSFGSRDRAMVQREWQAALSKMVKGKCRFVVVRLDEIDPPAIIDDLEYIDMYSIGNAEALKQMIAVCRGEKKIDIRKAAAFDNLAYRLIGRTPRSGKYEVFSRRFSVSNPTIAFHVLDLCFEDFDLIPPKSEGMYRKGKMDKVDDNGNLEATLKHVTLMRAITPHRPLQLDLLIKKDISEIHVNLYYYDGKRLYLLKCE